ncbi:hypothetical protein ACM64Y_01760 [Novispirillum sp. DQ9]|uniref:ribosome modulation factor n=1 Tax=Novispirillum sp. DQ9 TaxID=3398612 RepID=UPI003C7EBCB9
MKPGPKQAHSDSAYHKGQVAALLGRELDENPYSEARPYVRAMWRRGFLDMTQQKAGAVQTVRQHEGQRCRA